MVVEEIWMARADIHAITAFGHRTREELISEVDSSHQRRTSICKGIKLAFDLTISKAARKAALSVRRRFQNQLCPEIKRVERDFNTPQSRRSEPNLLRHIFQKPKTRPKTTKQRKLARVRYR